MELEKFNNYAIRNLLLTKFNVYMIPNNIMGIKFTLYFKNLYIVFLSILVLNLIFTKTPSLIFSFRGYNLGVVPVGAYFFISGVGIFRFMQKFLLLFLGAVRSLNTLYIGVKDKKINLPVPYDFSDLFELSTFTNFSIINTENLSYNLSFNITNTNLYYNEFLLRSFRFPIIYN